MAQLELLADRAAGSCAEQLFTHRLYLGLASFTAPPTWSPFGVEVMVMLSQHDVLEDLRALDNAIVASISPEMMAQSAAIMLPAMNIGDQTELFSGVQAGAPAGCARMMGLAQSVLEPVRFVRSPEPRRLNAPTR